MFHWHSQMLQKNQFHFTLGSLIESLSELSKCLAKVKKDEISQGVTAEKKNQGAIESGVEVL